MYNRTQHKQAIVALFLLGITALAVVFVYAQTVDITKMLMKQKTGARVDKALDEAVSVLEQKVSSSGENAAEDVYSVMLISLKEQEGSSVEALNTGKKAAYYKQYIDRINAMYGSGGKALAETLERYLPSMEGGKYIISTEPGPELVLDYDEQNCELRQCFIRDIVIGYVVGDTVIEEKTCTCEIPSPEVSFSDESINFYDYSLIGMKGIYITGETSSFVGSIYAGTHEFEESREAELAFGEKDPYGGLNMLTTQAAMFGNSIVTTGDINLKGAFVLFGNQDNEISIYANTINDIENYPSKTEYTVNGSLFLRDGSVEFTDAEHYENIVNIINGTADLVDNITSEYSSANDSTYTGRYSKIISDRDITLTDDFTGVIITAGNVIIENGCNVEGLVIAGDRIYIFGNNNIVSGREVVRTIVNEEKSSGSDVVSVIGNSHRISDFIEAMPDKGVIIAP